MSKLTYKTKLLFDSQEDKQKIIQMIEAHDFTWNECSKVKFSSVKDNSIKELHNLFYKDFRDKNPEIPSQVVIRAEQSVLSAYRSAKSNKHKITAAFEKKKLSIRLDKRIFSVKNQVFSIVSLEKRVKCKLFLYSKLETLLSQYKFCDPLLSVKNNEVWICLTFEVPELVPTNKLALGIDVGIKNFAATSEGNIYRDKKFNARKRKLRYQKRQLQSKNTKSARRKLKKLRHKERDINKNFVHCLTKRIIKDTDADVLVLENLKSIKVKKHKYQNKNRISQVPIYEFRRVLTYKALLFNKQVITVCPAYTSQIDCRTNKKDGVRQGSRYTGKDKQTLHADCNAAVNIAKRSKLPCSIRNYFSWQVFVNGPIVGLQ